MGWSTKTECLDVDVEAEGICRAAVDDTGEGVSDRLSAGTDDMTLCVAFCFGKRIGGKVAEAGEGSIVGGARDATFEGELVRAALAVDDIKPSCPSCPAPPTVPTSILPSMESDAVAAFSLLAFFFRFANSFAAVDTDSGNLDEDATAFEFSAAG